MLVNVFPIPTVLLQFLFLLVAIAIEGIILHRLLSLSRRTSIEYAASINLFTTVAGWLTFFFILPLISKPLLGQGINPLEGQLLSYIFFDRLLTTQLPSVYTMIILAGFIIFISAFLLKLISLKLLQVLLDDSPEHPVQSLQQKPITYRGLLNRKVNQEIFSPRPNQAIAVLVANACSFSALLLLLVVRFLQIHIYQP